MHRNYVRATIAIIDAIIDGIGDRRNDGRGGETHDSLGRF